MLNDLYLGLEKIADYSYKIFLECFNFKEESFAEATKFETYIAVFFYIDYCLASENTTENENMRENFYKLFKEKTIEKFSNKLSNTDLSDIIDHRYYDEYSQIPIKVGKDWLQSFNTLYEVKLKGTENANAVEKHSGIKAESIFEYIPKKLCFIKETGNIYKSMKLVKELTAGKSLFQSLKEIEIADLEIKRKFQEEGI